MAKRTTSIDPSSSEHHDETSSEEQRTRSSRGKTKRDSIKSYVTDVLTKHDKDDEQPTDLSQTRIKIETTPHTFREHENTSAFHQYPSTTEGTSRTNIPRQQKQSSSSDDELRDRTPTRDTNGLEDSITEINLDPNPVYEERESREQIYTQKVYLRQLQPPTPQPLEIEVQEVLIKAQTQRPPIHVHVAQNQPRTPSPIIIKATPPQPPPPESDHPIIYNKFVPPPKQPPQQIIIHRHPDLPPKPRPIVVEQWLPYKPAPKRIIKHSLPPEALQTPPPLPNIIVSYSKPRAVIEVELVRLPIVKIDPNTYQQMSAAGEQQLMQHPSFHHEQQYMSGNSSQRPARDASQLNWRI